MSTARVFRSGNSQAVRLPKQFRLKSEEVEIFRRGDEIVLREKDGTMARAFDLLAGLPDDLVVVAREKDQPQKRKKLYWNLATCWTRTSVFTSGKRGRRKFCAGSAVSVPGKPLFRLVTYGELLHGAAKSAHRVAALERLRKLAQLLPALSLPESAAEAYGSESRPAPH